MGQREAMRAKRAQAKTNCGIVANPPNGNHTVDHGNQPDQVKDLENVTEGDEDKDEDLDLLSEGRSQM